MSRESEMAKAAALSAVALRARAAREAAAPAPGTRTVSYDPRDYPPGLVGVPTVDWMYSESAEALMNLRQTLPPGSQMRFMPQSASSIGAKRTGLVENLLATPAPQAGIPRLEWLLQCDSDMIPPLATVLRLLSHNLDIVAGLYVARQPPYAPCVQWIDDRGEPTWQPPIGTSTAAPVRVAAVGFGCVLVKRHVFETIGAPWFHHAKRPGGGEDEFFCERARAFGFKLYIDMELEIGHLGVTAITPSYGKLWKASPEGRRWREEYVASQRHVGNIREEHVADFIANG